MPTLTLPADLRDYFAAFAHVIFTNPFSDSAGRAEAWGRLSIDRALSGEIGQDFVAMAPGIGDRLAALDANSAGRFQQYTGEDRELVRYAALFAAYAQFLLDFDRLIEAQLEAGARSVPVAFAPKLVEGLERRGFPRDEANRYLAFFYQLRRAYYFIEQALVGRSRSMRELRRALWNHVFSHDLQTYETHLWNRMEDFSTLLIGETGTGKGAAAASIGRSGFIPFDARTGVFQASFLDTFLAANLSEFPEGLIESELFGHRKGAFTGAVDHHRGLFERCSPFGSLFLDEIGDVTVPVQIKLLRVLQERTFSPVGSHDQRRFQGRIIAATNQAIGERIERGEFREDFYYRLSSDIIRVPPLRQRIEESDSELPDLARLLVHRLTGSDALAGLVIERLARDVPSGYRWPGNVRELEQAIRRILLSGHYHAGPVAGAGKIRWLDEVETGKLTARALLSRYAQLLYQRLGSFQAVARQMEVDARTAKRYVSEAGAETGV